MLFIFLAPPVVLPPEFFILNIHIGNQLRIVFLHCHITGLVLRKVFQQVKREDMAQPVFIYNQTTMKTNDNNNSHYSK